MFRNATVFTLPADFEMPPLGELDEAIAAHMLRSPSPQEMETRGLAPPSGSVIAGNTRFTMGVETRLVPASVIQSALDEKYAEHEQRTGRKPGKRLRAEMRDAVMGDLLPRAFVQQKLVDAYFDRELRMLIIDTTSSKTAEAFVSLLRDALGSFPARPLQNAPAYETMFVMTRWVTNSLAPDGFTFGDECEFKDQSDNTSQINCRRQDLGADEIREHARVGKEVTKIGLTFDDRISFVLDASLKLRKLKFLDAVRDQLDPCEDAQQAADAEFALMSLELRRLIVALDDVLGWVR